MKKGFATLLTVLAGLGFAAAEAQPASDSVDGHVMAARKAADFDFMGTFIRLCVQPQALFDHPVAPMLHSGPTEEVPDRSSWYTRPYKAFDNLYFVGTKIHNSWALKTSAGIILIDTLYNYAAEPEIVQGLKTLGLDPATIKYVIVSHGHSDHDEGARLLQDRYHARIVAGGPDWDSMTASEMPGGTPKRDIVATDGQRITLGDTTVTIYLTPGHTPGTLSYIFQVKDRGKPLTVAYSGGTAYVFAYDKPHLTTYLATQEHFARIAADAGASVLLSNHTEFDDAYNKVRELAARRPGDPNPFVVGTDGVARYFTVTQECAKAGLARIKS